MADQNNSASAGNLNSPAKPEEKTLRQFSVHSWPILERSFSLISYSNNSDHSHSSYSHSRRDQENVLLV